jgi:hypothetical protein
MREIKTLPYQTLFDIAIQETGSIETVWEILADNSTLINQNDLPPDTSTDPQFNFDLGYPITPGTIILIRE